ncbi:hypothetical protein QNM99_03665 [Pseudomonas sp. PCH446]
MSEQIEGLEPIDYIHPNGTKATITFKRAPVRHPNQIEIKVEFINSRITNFHEEAEFSSLDEARRRGIQATTDWIDRWKG